jgi:hypothetical protein
METNVQDANDLPVLIGQLYGRWTLDCIVEIAYAVSLDFVARPQMYVGPDIPPFISDFRVAYGTHKQFQNTVERQAMLMPILGRSDGLKPDATVSAASFHMARKKFLDACVAYSERAVDTGLAMLEDRVRSALVPFQAHFLGVKGIATSTAGRCLSDVFTFASEILKAHGVTRVFGQDSAHIQWPLESTDPNGAKLVDAIGCALPLAPEYKFTYTRFVLLQRLAQEGIRALTLVLNSDSNASSGDLAKLITQGYAWGSSLRDFQQSL